MWPCAPDPHRPVPHFHLATPTTTAAARPTLPPSPPSPPPPPPTTLKVISATLATRSAFFRGLFEVPMLDARLVSLDEPTKRALVLGAEDEEGEGGRDVGPRFFCCFFVFTLRSPRDLLCYCVMLV